MVLNILSLIVTVFSLQQHGPEHIIPGSFSPCGNMVLNTFFPGIFYPCGNLTLNIFTCYFSPYGNMAINILSLVVFSPFETWFWAHYGLASFCHYDNTETYQSTIKGKSKSRAMSSRSSTCCNKINQHNTFRTVTLGYLFTIRKHVSF